MSNPKWTRPESLPFPKVWRRFTGKRPMENGTIPKFRIQDVTEDLEDAVVEHMLSHFIRDEPMGRSIKVYEDPGSIEDFIAIYKEAFKMRISVVALVDEEDSSKKPIVAGVHMLGVQFKGEKDFDTSKLRGEVIRHSFRALNYITSLVNVYEKYGVDQTLTEKGLSVAREFRGQGIGVELLKAKADVGRAIGLKIAPMVCSAIESQICAEKAGYELIAEVPYSEYIVDGKVAFEVSNVPSMKYYVQIIQ